MKTIRSYELIQKEHPELLKDESNLSGGHCEEAVWPETSQEAVTFFKNKSHSQRQVTISGARTGITGGAIPMGGSVVSTNLLKGICNTSEENIIRVKAGETLDSVYLYCKNEKPGFFYPPDPTETTASIGGTISTDASGAGSYKYGSTRKWITQLKIILPSGYLLKIKRGDHRFVNSRLNHKILGKIKLPILNKPQPVKNAAGLYIEPNMDLIDLFIGSEGKLGLIIEADLLLKRKPYSLVSFGIFCNEEQFWKLRSDLMNSKLSLRELEAIVNPSLAFLEKYTDRSFKYPGDWVLITSIEVSSEDDLDKTLEILDNFLKQNGISDENTQGGFDETERKYLKEFRHLLPETVNRVISSYSLKNNRIHKISTDAAVAPELLEKYYKIIKQYLTDSGVTFVIFGHAGQGHLHANLLPENDDMLKKAEYAGEQIAKAAVKLSGTVSAEHGTGRLKEHLLKLMYSQNELNQMDLLVKSFLDLNNTLQ